MQMSSTHPNTSYTLAWICALPEEYEVAIAFLDEIHGIPQHQPLEDKNAYLLGRIGQHHVVMVCLPAGRMGTAAAASVAENLCRTFWSVRYGLLVGIGGGVPGVVSGKDIRLGDVVVSVPGGGNGGVVQYDLEDGEVHHGQLNSPPEKLLSYVTLLNILMRSPRISGNCFREQLELLGQEYEYPAHLEDRLFCSRYWHQFEGGCEACGNNCGEIYRNKRDDTLPAVHLGTIASGNTVVGDGVTRDMINHRYGNSILCFEMEAAGIMNALPCLVVRGISDYADSRKNDEWRPRAIAGACSYAKALILHIPREEVPQHENLVHVTDLVKDMRDELGQIKAAIAGLWHLQKGDEYTKSHTVYHRLKTLANRSVSITASITSRITFPYYGFMQASQYLRHWISLFFDNLKRYIWSIRPGQPSRDRGSGPSGGALPSVLSIQGWGWHLIAEPHVWMSS
ncbi:Pfs, NACHT and ankyrin domain protein [Aspergillus niger ATCC 13496]|uniref:Pfs, NACHT and ankyrin domain protein n=2 Tax=Aspergillus niger TaxID=5061 RepID=A0A370C2G2_ASPNG|nr:Pfs, NACHT and ankyrin domain protein [Aspergillus niger ATCC 13496]